MATAKLDHDHEPKLRADALRYVARRWNVLPIAPRSKAPICQHGVHDATKEVSKIEHWFSRDANIGIAAGRASDLLVIDVDAGRSGFETLGELQDELCTLPDTACVQTGGGGRHLYFRHVDKVRNGTDWRPGIDVKTDGGYVVAPSSVHESGKRYEWLFTPEELGIAVLPEIWKKHLPSAKSLVGLVGLGETGETGATGETGGRLISEITPHVLTQPHTRNLNTFRLAQAVKSVLDVDSFTADGQEELEHAFTIWWEPSSEFTILVFEEAFQEFLRAYRNVQYPKGSNPLGLPPLRGSNQQTRQIWFPAAFFCILGEGPIPNGISTMAAVGTTGCGRLPPGTRRTRHKMTRFSRGGGSLEVLAPKSQVRRRWSRQSVRDDED